MIEEHVTINFFLKEKNETSNNTSSLINTVTENGKTLETERGNSSPNSHSKRKRET